MTNIKTVSLNKTWTHLTTAIHRLKLHHDNLIKREAMFALQILLSKYELAKSKKNKKLIKFYADILKTYEKHDINEHVVWKK